MATKNEFGKKILGGLLGGVLGFILGTIITGCNILPVLAWDNIVLLFGAILGFTYADELF